MNEQLIQKLVDESGLKDILADHAKKYPGIYQEPIEEFAKLIVEECIVIMNREIDQEESKEKNRTISDMMDLLEQHFGVEE